MKRILTVLSLALLVTAGCTKTDNTTAGQCQTGTIHFISKSLNPYNLFIDGKSFQELGKKSTLDHTVFNGTYAIRAEQASGYKVDPTIVEYQVTIKGCDVVDVVIPKTVYEPAE